MIGLATTSKIGTCPVDSGTHPGLGVSSLGGDSLSSFNGGVSKFVLGLGPVQDKCLGLGGCGDALRPNWGRLGEALPPGKVAFLLWRRGKTAKSSAHQRASSLLAALTNVTLSGLVRAREWGWPVTCSAPVTSSTLDISTEPWGIVSGYEIRQIVRACSCYKLFHALCRVLRRVIKKDAGNSGVNCPKTLNHFIGAGSIA